MLEEKVLDELKKYVNYYQERIMRYVCYLLADIKNNSMSDGEWEKYLDENLIAPFSRVLSGFMDEKGAGEADLYQRAGIDGMLFSKIRSNPRYRPGVNTVIALAMALELDKDQAESLLRAAGYSLSEGDTFDLVIRFCLEKGIYGMDDINQALDYFSLKPLGGVLE